LFLVSGCTQWQLALDRPEARISYPTQEETEPAIAVDPADHEHVAAAMIGMGQWSEADHRFINRGCRISYSNNGGTSWQRFLINAEEFDRAEFSDPSVAIDTRGVSYVSGFFHSRDNAGGFSQILPMLARVGPGANQADVITFTDSSGRRFDKPYVAVSQENDQTRLYIVYTSASATNDYERQIRAIVIDNPDALFDGAHSQTIKLTSTILAQGNNWGAQPAVGPDGEVYVAWLGSSPPLVPSQTNFQIKYVKREAGGLRWSEPQLLAELDAGQALNGLMRYPRYPVFAVSREQITRGWLYATFADQAPLYVPVTLPRAERINALRINNQGNVVGWFKDRRTGTINAFRRNRTETYDVFSHPGAISTVANGINEQGVVAGSYSESAGVSRGYIWREGSFTSIDYPDSLSTRALDIANDGRVVGWFVGPDRKAHGFIRAVDGSFVQRDRPGAEQTFITGVNNDGVIVGYSKNAAGATSAFRYQDDNWSPLPIAGAISVQASDINNDGDIVGSYTDAQGNSHGFVIDGGATTPVSYPGAASVYLSGINDAREISGYTLEGDFASPFVMTGFGQEHESDIWMMRSSNGGDTWHWPVRVNHGTQGDQFFPWACSAGDGSVFVTWLDRRDDPDNLRYHLYATATRLGSLTFLDDLRITTRSSNPTKARAQEDGHGFIGDYIGLACGADRAYPVWPDLRDAPPQDIFSARLRLVDP
jgi:probable HAF family extracellular repeat protein